MGKSLGDSFQPVFCPLIDRSSLMSLTQESCKCPVRANLQHRVGVPQFSQQLALQCFHLLGFGIFDVIVAEQMQAAMDNQMRPVRVEGLALFRCLALDHRHADDRSPSSGMSRNSSGTSAGNDSTLVA